MVWTHNADGHRDIMARRFDSSGSALGARFAVASNSTKGEVDPDVAMDAAGNFVVSYTLFFDGTDPDILAKRFNSAGVLTRAMVVANSAFSNESNSSVAMNAKGDIVIAWGNRDDTLADEDIFVTRFDPSGAFAGNQAIGVSNSPEEHPSVALDNAGDAVVVYQKVVGSSFDIKARRMTASGAVGPEFTVRATAAQELNPTVALSRNGGGSFVVAYETDLIGIPNNRTVEVAEVSASNVVTSVFNLPGFPNNDSPSLSVDAQGNYVLTYTGGVGFEKNIRMRRGRLS